MALAMFAVLLGLGTWQVKRLAWKEAILARIAQAEAAPAIPLPAHPAPFTKVSVRGRFLPGPTALFGVSVQDTPLGPVLGAEQIVPLAREDGAVVLVDRGWVPTESGVPAAPTGPVTIEGYIREPDRPRLLGAGDDLARRQFFTLDPTKIGTALGLARVAPFTLVAMGRVPPGVTPMPARHLPRPPNNHLSYAITWYGLAAGLVAVFASWARTRLAA